VKINEELAGLGNSSSNLSQMIFTALNASTKLAAVWASGDWSVRTRLQKLVFPEGIIYSHKNDKVLTPKVNTVFLQIAQLAKVSGKKETGQADEKSDLSSLVGTTGFEPATPCTPCKYATGLRYVPKQTRCFSERECKSKIISSIAKIDFQKSSYEGTSTTTQFLVRRFHNIL
jgi:hypothetical protein